MHYLLGLDIGITSVGWSVLESTETGEPCRIVDFGSRIFEAAEQPKTGESLAAPRRDARGARRRNRRHRHRIERIKKLLINHNILSKQELLNLYTTGSLKDIYKIRYESLNRSLKKDEFARLLIHLAQRRGFKSNRKKDADDKEAGKLVSAVKENDKIMLDNSYRTIGEMLYKNPKFENFKRNKADSYANTVSRADMLNEINIIFASQRELGNELATQDLEEKYIEIWGGQRDFDQGPACGPYSGNQIEKMIGRCTFEKDLPRAAKASYTSEYFILLQNINNIRIILNNDTTKLSDTQRHDLINLCLTSPNVNFSKIRKTLNMTDSARFSALSYGYKDFEEVEKKTTFNYLKAYHEMRKAFDKISKGYINSVSTEKRDCIGYALTVFKTDDKVVKYLKNTDLGFSEPEISAILTMPNFSKVSNLSLKAMQKITPFLEDGHKYNEACKLAGYDFKAHDSSNKSRLLKPLPKDCYEITSPVVKRAVSQTIKIINSVIRRYGSPLRIHVELARETAKNFRDRKQIEKQQLENRAANERIKERLREEFGVRTPTGLDILKYRLWEEQDGRCPYSGSSLDIEKIFSTGYCDIDHIIPYSLTFDDSYKNKVLVRAEENRQKRNRLPLEYITDKEARDRYIAWVNMQIKDPRKREILLREKLSSEEINDWKERSLNDTKFISRFMINYINDNLEFDPAYPKKKRVIAVNGAITAYMRRRFGINKVRADGDLHHAIDAIVIACITDGIIKRVTNYMKYRELEYTVDPETGELLETHSFPEPWPEFRKELEYRLDPRVCNLLRDNPLPGYDNVDIDKLHVPFVSRMKKEKNTGAAHAETIRGYEVIDGTMYTISKTALTNLKLNNKTGEIDNYYHPGDDILLYNLLKQRLIEFDNKPEKAFAEPVYKPTPKGGKAPLVKKVKVMDKITSGVAINNGIAANGSMIRIDVYYTDGKNGGYYAVPIYTADTVGLTLPNKAIIAHKPYTEWPEMNDDDFKFSLYPNDLIKITSKKDMEFSVSNKDSSLSPKRNFGKEIYVYYKSCNISSGTIRIITDDNSYCIDGLGIKTLLNIEKYNVDILGNIQKAAPEKRMRFR